jgi:hypothetical protein
MTLDMANLGPDWTGVDAYIHVYQNVDRLRLQIWFKNAWVAEFIEDRGEDSRGVIAIGTGSQLRDALLACVVMHTKLITRREVSGER